VLRLAASQWHQVDVAACHVMHASRYISCHTSHTQQHSRVADSLGPYTHHATTCTHGQRTCHHQGGMLQACSGWPAAGLLLACCQAARLATAEAQPSPSTGPLPLSTRAVVPSTCRLPPRTACSAWPQRLLQCQQLHSAPVPHHVPGITPLMCPAPHLQNLSLLAAHRRSSRSSAFLPVTLLL
jgi:hypothetical protein